MATATSIDVVVGSIVHLSVYTSTQDVCTLIFYVHEIAGMEFELWANKIFDV